VIGPDDRTDKKASDWFAQTLSGIEDNQKALASLDARVRQHPDQAQGYFRRGYFRAMTRQGDEAALDEARADFARALERDPGDINARMWRAWIAARRKDLPAAIADYSWVIEHLPERTETLVERGKLFLKQHEIDRAMADFDRAVAAGPGTYQSSALVYRGWCHAAKGQHDQAIADLSRVIENSVVAQAWVYRARAGSYRAIGEPEKALDDLDRALSIQPRDPSVCFLRAEILMELGDYTGATWEADRLRRLLPDRPGPQFLHSVSSWLAASDRDSNLAEIVEGSEWIERIVPGAPAPAFIRILAVGLTGRGRESALADMDRCIALQPDVSFPYACRAIFNAHQGRVVPTCRDLGLFILLFDRREYHPFASIDRRNRRFMVGFYLTGPHRKASTKPQEPVADIGGKCMDMGFQQLLAAAFHSSR
jgi:tetratricopeptide (TPR) repeat protein